jgi:hypothetical protein
MASKTAAPGAGNAAAAAAAEDAGGKKRDSLLQDLLPVDGTPPAGIGMVEAAHAYSGSGDGASGGTRSGLRWDSWTDVQDSFRVSRGAAAAADSRDAGPSLSAVCFAHRWSPAAINAARAFHSARGDCQSSARLFLIDAAAEGPSLQEEVARLSLGYTPAYVIYRRGVSGGMTPLEVRRRGGGPHSHVIFGHLAPEVVVRILRMASMRLREEEGPGGGGGDGAALVVE